MSIVSDPRHRNETFDTSSIGAYLCGYTERLGSALQALDEGALGHACRLIVDAAHAGRRVYSIGNGGSAAVADHLCCDLTKGTHAPGHPIIDATSLTANVALYSALANDFGFEKAFAKALMLLGKPGDILIAISSSGNSANILEAIDVARQLGMSSIGLCGFDGGHLKGRADATLHIDVANYGIVEDAHQAIMHILAQYIASGRDQMGLPE